MTNMNSSDTPGLLFMGAAFFAFGLTMIVRPGYVRTSFDRLHNSWKQDSWHPYKLPFWGLRSAGVVIVTIATILFYAAYLSYVR
jgi:hypothetical protein